MLDGINKDEYEVDSESDYDNRKDDSIPGATKIGSKLNKKNSKI